MALRTNRVVLRKYAQFYTRVRVSEGSDSDDSSSMHSPASVGAYPACSTASFTWLQRACSLNGPSFGVAAAQVPLSESPKRELRMRSASKMGRHSKKQKKSSSKPWW